jgi:3-hydroxy-9,10-secoandrosta-1,3,5(10)-triene-9,17-dione monooxygenase reductase component
VSEPGGQIHPEHPFQTPLDLREPARRLRGRLAMPVTIWTAYGADGGHTGLTVSSVLVAEGKPSAVIGLINDTTDLWDALNESKKFVVHILDDTRKELGERFAGLRPSPGGIFRGLVVQKGDCGPVLTDLPDRAHCTLFDTIDAGYQRMVRGLIETVEVGELDSPLVHFRGDLRGLAK